MTNFGQKLRPRAGVWLMRCLMDKASCAMRLIATTIVTCIPRLGKSRPFVLTKRARKGAAFFVPSTCPSPTAQPKTSSACMRPALSMATAASPSTVTNLGAARRVAGARRYPFCTGRNQGDHGDSHLVGREDGARSHLPTRRVHGSPLSLQLFTFQLFLTGVAFW